MSTKTTSTAQIAGDLAGNPEITKEVEREIAGNSFVTHLLKMRVSKGFTQEQVARSIGCNASRISRLESGDDSSLKWPDITGYTAALGMNMCLIFEDPSQPAAERIKNYVFKINEDLENLTNLAKQVGGNDDIAKKIHQFSGEVLLNFVMRHQQHAEKLNSILKVSAGSRSPALKTTFSECQIEELATSPSPHQRRS